MNYFALLSFAFGLISEKFGACPHIGKYRLSSLSYMCKILYVYKKKHIQHKVSH